MFAFLRRRIYTSTIPLVIVLLGVFLLARLTGDPTNLYLPESATPDQRAAFAEANGFNDPLITQLIDSGRSNPGTGWWSSFVANHLSNPTSITHIAIYFGLIVFFTYFYVSITFNPEERADEMKKFGGFIPGIRPGKPTADYLNFVLSRITLPGSIYLGVIAVLPNLFLEIGNTGSVQNLPFGGTAVLIAVVAHPTGATVILTQRPHGMRDHSGQIAFPGGKIEADAYAVTALDLFVRRMKVGDLVVVTHNGSPRAMDTETLASLAEETFGPERVVTAPNLPDAIEAATALVEESGNDGSSDGFSGAGMVITGSVVTAGAARTLFGKDPA